MFSSPFCWDISLGVLAFPFRFVSVIIKWLVHLHLSCLHTITFRGKKKKEFCFAHVILTGGKIFHRDFYPQNTSSKSPAGIRSRASALAQREDGRQISGLFPLPVGRQFLQGMKEVVRNKCWGNHMSSLVSSHLGCSFPLNVLSIWLDSGTVS